MEINKESELGKLLKKIIEEQKTSDNIKKIKEIENEINSLHENTRFFKTVLATAMALDKTIEFVKNKDSKKIPILSLADIITGIVIQLEEEGLVKIIREKEEKE